MQHASHVVVVCFSNENNSNNNFLTHFLFNLSVNSSFIQLYTMDLLTNWKILCSTFDGYGILTESHAV